MSIAKKFTYQVALVGSIVAFALGVNYLYAWTGPLSTAPNCTAGNPGCDAPLNIGTTAQVKNGNVSVGASANASTTLGLTVFGGQYINGWLNVGDNIAPTALISLVGRPGIDGIKFPDGTLQTTAAAASSPVVLKNVRYYTSAATWSKPANLSYVVVEVWGGGAGGTSRGGSGRVLGAAGGTSSFGSLVSATGGSPSTNGGDPYQRGGVGGTGSTVSGTTGFNITGGQATGPTRGTNDYAFGGTGGNAPRGGPGGAGGFGTSGTESASISDGKDGVIPGGGGGGGSGDKNSQSGAGGGAGGYAYRVFQATALAASYAVTVGAGGAGGASSVSGGDGAAGMVVVYEYGQ